MSKQSVLNAKQAERLLLNAGFLLIRSKGSHRIYKRDNQRMVLPFHGTKILHPKITKSVLEAISK